MAIFAGDPIPWPFDVVTGAVPTVSLVNKTGRNSDVDIATVPEDVWEVGGTYTGFPLGAPETLNWVSTSASDTGTVRWLGLKSNTSETYEMGSVVLNGTTPVNSSDTWYRVHTAWYDTGSPTTFNIGTITCKHTTTTANVFLSIVAGRSQSNMAGITVPYNRTGIITKASCYILGTPSAEVVGNFWLRENGRSPRLRIPFEASTGASSSLDFESGLALPALTDIMPRIVSSIANNTDVVFSYGIYFIT